MFFIVAADRLKVNKSLQFQYIFLIDEIYLQGLPHCGLKINQRLCDSRSFSKSSSG